MMRAAAEIVCFLSSEGVKSRRMELNEITEEMVPAAPLGSAEKPVAPKKVFPRPMAAR
jgi:hypothetical protein